MPGIRTPHERHRLETLESIANQMFGVVMLLKRETAKRMAEHGLTDAQWKPLWLLQNSRARTAIELSRELDVDTAAVVRMLDRLESKGLIVRERAKADRRVVHLHLTLAGEAAAGIAPTVLSSIHGDLLRCFSQAELVELNLLLTRMADSAKVLGTDKGRDARHYESSAAVRIRERRLNSAGEHPAQRLKALPKATSDP